MNVWIKCLNALDDFLDDVGDSFLALDFPSGHDRFVRFITKPGVLVPIFI